MGVVWPLARAGPDLELCRTTTPHRHILPDGSPDGPLFRRRACPWFRCEGMGTDAYLSLHWERQSPRELARRPCWRATGRRRLRKRSDVDRSVNELAGPRRGHVPVLVGRCYWDNSPCHEPREQTQRACRGGGCGIARVRSLCTEKKVGFAPSGYLPWT